MSAEGRGAEAAAIDEFVRNVIEPNTVMFVNEPCHRRCGAEAVCEYCGTNLCCTKGVLDNAGGACGGLGGERAACTAVPAVEASPSAKAQMARAMAARLVLAAGAVDYAAPVDMFRLEVLLGLKPEPEPGADDAGGGAAGGATDAADDVTRSAAASLPLGISFGSSARLSSRGSLPVECSGPRKGAARWLSCGALAPHRAGDLEKEGELEAAVAARAWRASKGERPELILTYANEIGTAWVRASARYRWGREGARADWGDGRDKGTPFVEVGVGRVSFPRLRLPRTEQALSGRPCHCVPARDHLRPVGRSLSPPSVCNRHSL
jgi:hypothetical protein